MLKILPSSLTNCAGCNNIDYIRYIEIGQSSTNNIAATAVAAQQHQWMKSLQVIAAHTVLSAATNDYKRDELSLTYCCCSPVIRCVLAGSSHACHQSAHVLMTLQCGSLSLFVLVLQFARRINVPVIQQLTLPVCTV